MTKEQEVKMAQYLRYMARTLLVMLTSLLFIFGLLSGAEKFGGGLHGILLNSPNALPWLILFIPVVCAWKWEKWSGVGIIVFGIASFFFFDGLESPFVFVAISLPLILMGGMLLGSWCLRKKCSVSNMKPEEESR